MSEIPLGAGATGAVEPGSATLAAALLAAVADDRRWADVAALLARELEVESLVAACRGLVGGCLDVVAAHGLDLEVVRATLAPEDASGSTAADRAAAWLALPPGRLTPVAAVEPWQTLAGLLGARCEAAMLVHGELPCDLVLWLVRAGEGRPFDAADQRRVDAVMAPLALAATASLRMRRAEGESGLLRHVLDRVAVGMLLAAPDGSVLLANRAARRILERGDGLWLVGDRLHVAGDEAATRLRDALEPRAGRAAAAIQVPRDPGGPGLELLVAPVEPRLGGGVHGASAVVFLVDPTGDLGGVEQHLESLYGLTPAEARLVARLLAGRSLSAAARDLGISRNTAHTQLAAVFAKTGATGQNDLLRRLLRGPSGAHREPTGTLPVYRD